VLSFKTAWIVVTIVRCVNLKLSFPHSCPVASLLNPVYNLVFAAFNRTVLANATTTVRKFRMNREDQLVERTVRAIPSALSRLRSRGVSLGIGDDAAVLAPTGRTEWVLSCDAFLEDVHFLANSHPPDSVGYKSLVRATSDLVAMGAKPRYFLLTLALPASRTSAWLDGFLRGMARAARFLGMRLIGGDTTNSRWISISITVLGEIVRGRALTRSGARPDDVIYVSGKLGRAQLGLELVLNNLARRRENQNLLRPHLFPEIRVKLGEWLAQNRIASAMMDISDGLSTDLGRLCKASGVGARIEAQSVPCVTVPPNAAQALKKLKLDPLQMALHGGDDYELLFTVPPGDVKRLRRAPGFSEMSAIGRITRDRKTLLLGSNGSSITLAARGWDSFRKK
jgi:thiamine-monophosphate kinase